MPAKLYKHGVTETLRNAFVGISLFSLLSAVVGIASYQVIGRAQNELLDQTVPAAIAAERVASLGFAVVAATPALLAAGTIEELDVQVLAIDSNKAELAKIILQMRNQGVHNALLDSVTTDLDTVFINLAAQVDLIAIRNRTGTLLRSNVNQVLDEAGRLVERLRPGVVDASAQFLRRSDEVRAALALDAPVQPSALEALEQLTDTDFFEVERLTRMRFLAESILSNIDRLLLTVRPDNLASLSEKLRIELRSLARSGLDLPDGALRQTVAGALQGLSAATSGPGNIVDLQSELISIDAALVSLGEQNRVQVDRLLARVGQLLDNVADLTEVSTARARDAVTLGQIALSVIAATAIAAAIFVIWNYVLRKVGIRIRRLATITRALASGDLDIDIDITGTDELGEMADAVRVFKANAIELNRSNTELQQFAYIASHDLKAPLRGITNLAGWIEEDLEDTADSKTKEHLTLLQGRIGRMDRLLEDLLQYSRAGLADVDLHPVDLAKLVPELFSFVSQSGAYDLKVDGSLPEFITATTPLEQILRNLFANAVKHHDKPVGTVTFAVDDEGQSLRFTVQDDGPGIAPQDHERIFGMFQTLRGRDEVEGSGMGLALIKKLLASVDCDITVHSDPSLARGTTFVFTWPKHWQRLQRSRVATAQVA